jgi:hypothetical protein
MLSLAVVKDKPGTVLGNVDIRGKSRKGETRTAGLKTARCIRV